MSRSKSYPRFTLGQRIEHWVLLLSFTALAITGLPQKFVGLSWAESMIAVMGGIEQVRILHRYAAVVLMAQTIYHGIAVAYKLYVQRVEWTMWPRWQDVKDLFGTLLFNLGLNKLRPKLPRYNFEEKMEYWAVVWGTVIMAVTGFMLWNPIATTKLLPGSFIPAAKSAHGGEALLAVLAIIVWHLYGVHLRKFNKSMFSGQLSAEEMAHDHALELEQIENGTLPAPDPVAVQAKRARIFIPVATVILAILLFGLYVFIMFEETAIPTVAAAERDNNGFYPVSLSATGEDIHETVEAYTGPESCVNSGCHSMRPLETAVASVHSQQMAAAGSNPWLARVVENTSPASDTPPNCLVCHAYDLQISDLQGSAQTVRVAGGQTCLRCHGPHPQDDVHIEAGLACTGCHRASEHQIRADVACEECHAAMPHADPLLNSKHRRLDCRTCHVRGGVQVAVNAGQPVENPALGIFEPTVELKSDTPRFAWQTLTGQPASVEIEEARIVPVRLVTLRAPADLDPTVFARSGQAEGAVDESVVTIVASHGIIKDGARTCATCHGPAGDFDFTSLGYDQAQVDNLTVKSGEHE